jgi:hypothetical protein
MEKSMTDIFAIETPTRTVGLAVRADAGFRFYASDHAFVGLERRRYRRLEDIQKSVRQLTEARQIPAKAPRPSGRSGRSR